MKANVKDISCWQSMAMAAMAGGMAWGIRGQYGHETGAMTAGLLVGLAMVLLYCRNHPQQDAARAVAWGTIAIGFGGSMTYGQTVGLTHDAALLGNGDALRWGLLGLAIKGGIWIGFFGLFFGMGLSGVRYSWKQMGVLMGLLLALYFLGVQLINEPYRPESKELPFIYFSDDWRWEPGAELKPRREVWGGLLLALAGGALYAGLGRKDPLAPRLAGWAFLGGALGFPLGQSLQAWHAWNPEVFQQGLWRTLDPHINWWNMMETAFGAVMGAATGLGLWLNRKRIAVGCGPTSEDAEMRAGIAWILLAVHLALLLAVEFAAVEWVDALYDLGLAMALIPMICAAGSAFWPYAVIFPIVLIPIAGKTVRQLVYKEEAIQLVWGWIIYIIIPVGLAIAAAVLFYRRARRGHDAYAFARLALILSTWILFGLNFAFFRFPFPWLEWTSRTPNGIIFTLCAMGLTVGALWTRKNNGAGVFQPPKIKAMHVPSVESTYDAQSAGSADGPE